MEKRLFRNLNNKVIAGVLSGLADYLGYDVTLVRVLFAASVIFTLGTVGLAYPILWIVIPAKNDPMAHFSKFYSQQFGAGVNDPMFKGADSFNQTSANAAQTKWNTENAGPNFTMPNQPDFDALNRKSDSGRIIAGLVLILLGCFFLMKKLLIIPVWFSITKLWPLAFVALGIALIFKKQRKNEWEQFRRETEAAQKTNATAVTPQTQSNESEIKQEGENN